MADALVETWEIHNRINLYVLRAIDEKHLADVSASKGRSVAEQFAHAHNVRLMWLKAAAPEFLAGLVKLEKVVFPGRAGIEAALTQSGKAIAALIQKSLESDRKSVV